jgi:hypothetical protein
LGYTTVFGDVQLQGAKIDGMLYVDQSLIFGDQVGPALNARGAIIKGDISLRYNSIEGGADLGHSVIDGNIDCEGSDFHGNDISPGFDASDSEVKGNVFLRDRFKAESGVDLHHMTIAGTLECGPGQFIASEKRPSLDLYNAKVASQVVLVGGSFLGNDKMAGIFADGLQARSCLLKNAFAQGGVRLVLATIDGNLICDGGHFAGDDNVCALDASDANVKGNISLSNGFKASSGVDLHGARIDGALQCLGGSFIDPPYKRTPASSQYPTAIDLRLTKAATLANRADS